MNNGLGVALGFITVATRLKIAPQLLVIVDFSIEDDPEVAVFVRNWLMPSLHVYDAQAAHSQADVFLDENALIVRTTMNDLLIHHVERFTLDALTPIRKHDAADTTHD
jgi:hypothetical protein